MSDGDHGRPDDANDSQDREQPLPDRDHPPPGGNRRLRRDPCPHRRGERAGNLDGPGPGGVPANDYVSLAVANLTTTMTVLRVCYLNLAVAAFAQTNGGIFRMVTRGATIDRELDSQGGGQFAGQVNWSGLFNPGETVAVSFRTSGGSLFNFSGEISALPAAPFTQLTGN